MLHIINGLAATKNERSLTMKIYVGNLSSEVTEDEVKQEFAEYGEVQSVALITDRFTGQSRGFGFVEMPQISEGRAAIAGLNGKNFKDRDMVVNTARSNTDNRGSGQYNKKKGGSDFSKRRNKRY
jgi:cold-inducible RNA-binding protein